MTEDPVDIILRLINLPGFLAGTREAAAGIREIGAATEETDAATAAGAGSSGRFAGALGLVSKAGRLGALAMAAAAAEGTKMSINFDKQMEMIHTQAGASQGAVKQLSGEILGMAKSGQYSQGPEELAKGLYHLVSLGMKPAQALQALKVAAQGAAVGGANLEDVTTALGSAWITNIKGAGNFNHVMALANATVGAGNMRMGDLVTSLGTGVLPAAKNAGLGIKDVFSALAILSDEGWKGSSAMAQFATSLHFMTNPTAKATKALQQMGLGQFQLSRDLRTKGLIGALTDLKSHLDSFSKNPEQQKALLGDILPGGRGRVLMVLMNQLDRLGMKQKQITGTTKNFGDAVQKTHETTAFKLHAAWSQIQAELIGVGHSLQAPLAAVAQFAAKALGWFMKLPRGVHIAVVGVLAALALFATGGGIGLAIGAVIAAVALIISHWQSIKTFFKPVIDWLVGAFNWIKDQLGLSGKDFGGWSKNIHSVLTNIVKVAKAVFAVWKWLFENVFLKAVKLAMPVVVSLFKSGLNIIGGVIKVFSGLFTGNWGRMWDGVKQIASGAFHLLLAGLRAFLIPFKVLWSVVKGAVVGAWKGITGVIKGAWNGIIGFFKKAPGAVFNVFKTVWHAIGNAFKAAINWVIDIWDSLHFSIGGWTIHLPDPAPNISVPKITVGMPHIPHLAAGGLIVSPGSVLVGEQGPEILNLDRGASVHPLKKSQDRGVTPIDTSLSRNIKHTTIIQVSRRELARAVSSFTDDQIARQ